MRTPKAAIFDLGRVLLAIDPARPGFAELMRSLGVKPEEAFSVHWKEPEVVAHMTGNLSPGDFHQALCRKRRLDMPYPRFVAAWNDLFAPMPGMAEVFAAVRDRVPVGILSDTDPLHWARALEVLPWLATVSKPTLSFETGFLKPAPEMYQAAARNIGFAAHECVFIDDLPVNVRGAEKAGMTGVVFAGAGDLEGRLRGLGLV
ncbi:MAG: HAD family phosphatase [Planctomycetota bacterium]|nr:HAD family phosphatase [Planctomycetota bacterium]